VIVAIHWTEDLTTGVAEIDSQHKELFKRINGLLEACSQGKGRGEVDKVIKFLEDYVVRHFSEEEKYMVDYSYPAYGSHKAQHLEFMGNFFSLKGEFESDGPGVHIIVRTNSLVIDWLRNHIRKVDKELGTFLKARL
jgi:hemerythrin